MAQIAIDLSKIDVEYDSENDVIYVSFGDGVYMLDIGVKLQPWTTRMDLLQFQKYASWAIPHSFLWLLPKRYPPRPQRPLSSSSGSG